MSASILLVDDDRFVLRAIDQLLTKEGFQCKTASTLRDAEAAASMAKFDLLVLDVGLPDGDGFTLCRRIRLHHTMPILFLTARSDNADKVIGLELGADDYLTKPFEPRELLARVRAMLRRAGEYNNTSESINPPAKLHVGSLLIDTGIRDAFKINEPLHLTDKEFALLYYLARRSEQAISSTQIFRDVWGFDADTGPGVVAITIYRLRKKIEINPDDPRLLVTVRGFGYRLTSGERQPDL